MNNQKAAIKVGNDEFYVTNVSTSQTANAAGSVTPTQDVELTPFFSGITLDVTPQIDAQGDIILHIHPSISQVKDQQKQIDLGSNGTLTLPLANSTIRESDTIVHAKNGQVVVIGGLMENHTQEGIAGFPPVANIPYLGALFRGTRQNSRKSELVILLRPMVVKRGTMTDKVKSEISRMRSLKRGFHVGSRPDIYGTEGEQPIKIGPKAGILGPQAAS
jgi:MSHA biogenesis protein MshL